MFQPFLLTGQKGSRKMTRTEFAEGLKGCPAFSLIVALLIGTINAALSYIRILSASDTTPVRFPDQ